MIRSRPEPGILAASLACLWLCFLAVTLTALVALPALAGQARAEAPVMVRPDRLTVVLDDDYPPCVFRAPDGDVQGILVDTGMLWEKKTGVPVSPVAMDWNAAQEFVRQDKADTLFPSALVRYTLWTLAAVAAAALVLAAFNVLLRRRVRRQTFRLRELLTAMGQSEERYRELVEGANSVILRLDLRGRVTFCNAYGQRFLGYDQGGMLGRSLAELIEPQARQGELAELLDAISQSPESNRCLVRENRRRNGEPVWIAWAMRAVRDPDGQIREIQCIGNDVTERRRAEEALCDSQERYALVAKGANDGIWDWDLRTNTVYFSPRYMEILGYGPDAVGQSVEEWTKRIHPEDAEAVIRENKRCADGEIDNFAVEYRLRHKDGAYRWILGRGASLKNAQGAVVRMAGTHTDITRRKKDEAALRESQDRLSKLFRFSPVGIVVSARRDGRLIEVNEAAARLFGYAKNDVIGRTSLEIGLWPRTEDRDGLVAEIGRQGAVMAQEVELRHKNGARLVTLYSAVPSQAYGEACILSVLVDITERKAMEQALLRSKEAAEAANRAKSEFLSTMSHEIRTPMNTILGMTGVLAESRLSERQAEAIRAIEIAGGNLLGLLSDILDLSQIEAGGLIMEEKACDPVELAGNVVDMMRPDAAKKGLDLRLASLGELPASVFCCPERIRQVLVNLVGNAVKFTASGEIVVEVGREENPRSGPRLRLAVRDTGIGISADKLAAIFDRFTQVNATSSRHCGGVGLGLAICKKLVELMDGHIRVESQEGRGSAFTVTLPLRPASQAAETRGAAQPAGQASLARRAGGGAARVLLVEDSTTNAEVMRLMLEGSPFALTWAPSGPAALEVFRDQPFDIVLMDVEMPEMDGYQTTEALRRLEADQGRRRTPVIALTAHAFEEHRQRSLEAGCDDFQVKPIPKAKLLETLDTWMAVQPRAAVS